MTRSTILAAAGTFALTITTASIAAEELTVMA
jgi:hypothetical protein